MSAETKKLPDEFLLVNSQKNKQISFCGFLFEDFPETNHFKLLKLLKNIIDVSWGGFAPNHGFSLETAL